MVGGSNSNDLVGQPRQIKVKAISCLYHSTVAVAKNEDQPPPIKNDQITTTIGTFETRKVKENGENQYKLTLLSPCCKCHCHNQS